MASIVNFSKSVLGPFQPTKVVLSSSDTLTYLQGVGQELILFNPTAGVLTAVIDGDAGTTVPVLGAGSATFSVASGLSVTIPIGGFTVVRLDTVSLYLSGSITITGAATAVACIIY